MRTKVDRASAVALAAPDGVSLFCRVRECWQQVACVALPGAPHSLRVARGALYVGTSAQVIALSATLQAQQGVTRLAALLAAAHAPLPLWHPRNIALLVARGAHDAAAGVLKELLALLRGHS